jgi:hypothetical protein
MPGAPSRIWLREWDWDKQVYVEVQYSTAPIKEFIDQLRNTKSWRDDPYVLDGAYRKLNNQLAEDKTRLEKVRERKRAAMAKAREAKKHGKQGDDKDVAV